MDRSHSAQPWQRLSWSHGTSPILASLAAFAAGMIAGACTGTLYTRFKINSLLSGILVMTALYSINLHIMGQSNVPLLSVTTLATQSEQIASEAHERGYQLSISRDGKSACATRRCSPRSGW